MENRASLLGDPVDEHDRVAAWRTERLLELGYPVDDAIDLADSTVDVHELEQLIRRGCPPATAARILA